MQLAMRILVVDDERSIREGAKLLLRDVGYAAEPAADASAALCKLGESPWDVVVTDLQMPGMDGIALAREIKHRCPAVDVVLMTAAHSEETFAAAIAAGAAACLAKPFRFCELESCLAGICLRRREGRA